MQVTEIREIRKTTNENEVNFLLSEGWKLVSFTQIGLKFQYLLVKGE